MVRCWCFSVLLLCLVEGSVRSNFQQKVEQSDSLFNMYHTHPLYAKAKVCRGHDSTLITSWQVNPRVTYEKLRKRFGGRNCTHISGNLILSHLDVFDGKSPDLSFLETIEEVSGYVVIFAVFLPKLALPKLKIIRGVTAYPIQGHNCSLAVIHNHDGGKENKALHDLDLRSLRSVSYHDICFDSNIGMCYAPFTIKWSDFLEDPKAQKVVVPNVRKRRTYMGFCANYTKAFGRWLDLTQHKTNESLCHDSCQSYNGKRYCWTKDAATCQTLHKCQVNSCSRCFRRNGREQCCHHECVVGCHGPEDTQCVACRRFIDGRKCRDYCPRKTKYDPIAHESKPNPNYRLYLGGMCVKKCTAPFVQLDNSCVRSCPPERYITRNNTCVPCNDKCEKLCDVKDLEKQVAKEKGYPPEAFHLYTLRSVFKLLKNCTVVRGTISVNELSRKDAHNPTISKLEAVRPADLWNLVNIKKISDGVLKLQLAKFPEVKNLTFLRELTSLSNARLVVLRSKARFTGWLKLRYLVNSQLYLFANRRLCYRDGLLRRLIRRRSKVKIVPSKPPRSCSKRRCHRACHPKKGCAGPGPTYCYACRRFKAGPACVLSCNETLGFFATPAVLNVTRRNLTAASDVNCGKCHRLCRASCTGPANSQCVGGCRSLQNGVACVDRCPDSSYANSTLRRCLKCPKACQGQSWPALRSSKYQASACSGPLSRPGKGGCNFCSFLFIGKDKAPGQCLTHCPEGTYGRYLVKADIGNAKLASIKEFVRVGYTKACRPCHPQCEGCEGPGPYDCLRCRNFLNRRKCVSKCPEEDTYVEDRNATLATNATEPASSERNETLCRACHPLCRKGCRGPGPGDCNACAHYRIIEEQRFVCSTKCPDDRPFTSNDVESGDSACFAEAQPQLDHGYWRRIRVYIIVGVVTFLLAIVSVIIAILLLRQRALAKKETIRLQAKYTGALPEEEMEPLNPSHTQPNFMHLRMVNERELRRGHIIGTGAFGTVYKAEWLPPRGRNDVQQVSIPVAIKVLTDSSDAAENKELLEEARVMASVENPYCMRLIGVCMTAQMQLISQFMPLGSLLDYLRVNSASIGAKELLTWSAQIAKGMLYLKSRSIIHRDLAARNVLVQEPNHVRITDFGLAKLLDTNEEEYCATGGKMPVKWLALESIRHRRFTHKSDVWAYGVTLWELFTFGSRPYSDLNVNQVCNFLDSGERLPQPDICTLDVYMLMIKCWMVDEDSRPNFEELAEEVSKMARDPSRYLVVKGDELPCRARPSQTLPSPPSNNPRFGLLGPAARAEETEEEEAGMEDPETEEELDEDGRGGDGEEEYTAPSSEPAALCRPARPLKTTGAEPMSPLVAATPPHHVMGATGGRRYGGEVNRGAALPAPNQDRKYGHLEAELAKQRAPGATRWDRSRYATDPLDSPDASMPVLRHQTLEMGPMPDKKLVVDLPWKRRSAAEDDDDYLQPRTFADRSREPSPMSQSKLKETCFKIKCDVHPPSPALRHSVTSPRVPPQVLNPDYFDATEHSNYYNEAAASNRYFV